MMANEFKPDWADFQHGYECGLQEAADFCKRYIDYADSKRDHEELLNFVADGILKLGIRLSNSKGLK